jgi:hypothetical protein
MKGEFPFQTQMCNVITKNRGDYLVTISRKPRRFVINAGSSNFERQDRARAAMHNGGEFPCVTHLRRNSYGHFVKNCLKKYQKPR